MPDSLEIELTEAMVDGFASLSGDKSALHTDAAFARRSMYRRRVAHGMLPLMYLSFLFPRGPKPYGLKKISGRFLKPAFAGDRLTMAVTRVKNEAGAAAPILFEFSVKNSETGAVLTTGQMTVSHEKEPADNHAGAASPAKAGCLVLDRLTEADLFFEGIQKGDRENFGFRLLQAHAARLRALLAQRPLTQADPASFLALSLFSTWVGMRMPGRYATFMDFSCEFKKPFDWDRRYEFAGLVDFKSESTSTVSGKITIHSKESEGEAIAMGKINAKVNEPPARMPSIEALKKSETGLGLEGKVVLITGASRGIGETTAKLFSLHGAKVAVNYFQGEAEAKAVADEIKKSGGQAFAVRADVSDRNEVKKMVAEVLKKFGRIDVLVNNAVGDAVPIPFQELQWEQIQRDVDIVVKGAFNLCQEVIPHFQKNGWGRIINLSTVFTEIPPPQQTKYVVAKSALVGLTRSLAVELAASNITVNLVVSSLVETDLSRHVPKVFLEGMKNDTPMKRHASSADAAKAVVCLASNLASFTTGQKIMVTGGNAPFL